MIKKHLFQKILIIEILLFLGSGAVFARADSTDKYLKAIQEEDECFSAVYQKYQGALDVARCKCWPDQLGCLRPPGEDPACPEKYVPGLEQEFKKCRTITDEKKTPSSLEITQTPEGDFYDITINRVGRFNFPIKQKAVGAIVLTVTAAYVIYRKFKINRKILPILIGLGLMGGFLLVSGNIKIKNQKEDIHLPEVGVSNDEAQKAIDAVAKIQEVQDFKKLVEESSRSKFSIEIGALPTKNMPYYLVQVFEIFPDHQTTFAWYRYDPKSRKVTPDEQID